MFILMIFLVMAPLTGLIIYDQDETPKKPLKENCAVYTTYPPTTECK